MKFTHALTILFIALKLTNVIDWSWFWIVSPFIFGSVLAVISNKVQKKALEKKPKPSSFQERLNKIIEENKK